MKKVIFFVVYGLFGSYGVLHAFEYDFTPRSFQCVNMYESTDTSYNQNAFDHEMKNYLLEKYEGGEHVRKIEYFSYKRARVVLEVVIQIASSLLKVIEIAEHQKGAGSQSDDTLQHSPQQNSQDSLEQTRKK